MRVLMIENHDSFSWNVIDCLPVPRRTVQVVGADDGDRWRALLDEVRLVVIGPGPGDPVRLPELQRAVLLAVARRLPLLGVCLGHQALGVAFGARLVPTPPAHGQIDRVRFNGSRWFASPSEPLQVMRYHSLSLADVRAPLRVVATNAAGLPMAIEHGELPLVGVQFHPDSYATPAGRALVASFFDRVA
jgi:anthranilate synthase/aminodeoxychorismate synthase-like glutamine amidotransferase